MSTAIQTVGTTLLVLGAKAGSVGDGWVEDYLDATRFKWTDLVLYPSIGLFITMIAIGIRLWRTRR